MCTLHQAAIRISSSRSDYKRTILLNRRPSSSLTYLPHSQASSCDAQVKHVSFADWIPAYLAALQRSLIDDAARPCLLGSLVAALSLRVPCNVSGVLMTGE